MKSTTEKGHSIPSQKRAENLSLFQQSGSRKKEKELQGSGSPRQSSLVAGPSRSNNSMTRKHAEIASSSKKDLEVCPKHRKKGKSIFYGSDLQGNVDQVFLDGVSSHAVCCRHSHYVHNHTTNEKGKVNLEDNDLKDKQHVEPTIQSNRKTAVTTAEEDGSSFASYQSSGRRKALDFNVNMVNNLSHTYPINYDEKITSPHNHGQAFSETVSGRRRDHGWKKHVNGKEKCKSLHSKCGETSGSTVNLLSYTQSHAETCERKLDKSNKDKCYKLYPEIRGSNSDGQRNGDNLSAGVSQIESDEVFARELQQKFYHETTRFIDMEKVDTKIARSLQTDEVAKAAALASQGQSTPQVLFEEFGSNLNNELDLETRLKLLEAVEDMLENSYDDLEFSRSFNDNNYEMQPNIDESNHQHAGYSEINNFPLSVVQNGNNGEPCPVCLDVPSVGETVCHLPCLHKFHQACIDAWLKRKASCPVCKSKV